MTNPSETQTSSDESRTNIPKHPSVEISVRNFGPITSGDINLRPLTVFVGSSNTGKTYLSTLIYALHGVFYGFSGFPLMEYTTRALLNHELQISPNPASALATFWDFLEKFHRRGEPLRFSDLTETVREFGQRHFRDADLVSGSLKRYFDLDSVSELRQLNNEGRNKMRISLKVNAENQELWNFNMECSESEPAVTGGINEKMVLIPEVGEKLKEILPIGDFSALSTWLSKIAPQKHYLPSARGGIMETHRVMAGLLAAHMTRASLQTPTLSGVVSDLMEKLILYQERERTDDRINHIANALESEVLAGQIIMKPSPTGYPEFRYRPQKTEEDMLLSQSSSMVSELAPFILFLRGLICRGDTLFIEEPEAHLHPAAQAELAITLARLVRAGVRVLVTTHSDWLLKAIANLMHEGELKGKEALRKETEQLSRWLSPDEVGAWLFQKNGQVEEIKFNRINGIEPTEYEDVAEALYNRWAGLQNRLEGTKGVHILECE